MNYNFFRILNSKNIPGTRFLPHLVITTSLISSTTYISTYLNNIKHKEDLLELYKSYNN